MHMQPRRTRAVGLALACLVVASVMVTAPASAATYSCGGFAPTTTTCNSGTRTRVSGLVHDVAADFGYVGTVESALEWSSGTRTFRCTYTPDGVRTCLSSGTFPPVNASFTQRCRSLVPGTVVTVTQGVAVNGIAGGLGTWQCRVVV